MRRLKGRITKYMFLVYVGLLIGTALIMLEAIRAGYLFLAAGIPFIALTILTVLDKAHLAARGTRQLRLDFERLQRAQLKMSSTVSNASSRATDDKWQKSRLRRLERLEDQGRLRKIGLFTPHKVDTAAKGRQAAAVSEDPKRAFRLYAATQGLLSGTRHTKGRKRKVAVVGTYALNDLLAHDFDVIQLHPGMAEAQFEAENPSCVVIEEAALQHGIWSGALSATGTLLLKELLVLRDKAVARALHVYIIPSELIETSTRVLRDRATVIVDKTYCQAFVDTKSDLYDDHTSVIAGLVAYTGRARSFSYEVEGVDNGRQ